MSVSTFATVTAGRVDIGTPAAVLAGSAPGPDRALAVVPVDGLADAALAATVGCAADAGGAACVGGAADGGAEATTIPAGAGSGSVTGARASIASSRADI